MHSFHYNIISPPPPTTTPPKWQQYRENLDKWEWPTLEPVEVKQAIFTSSPKKAPGLDKVSFLILQKAYQTEPEIFY
jgi:hypothetical protein